MKNYQNKQEGNVLIIVMVLFVVVSLSVALGLVAPVLYANRIAKDTLESKRGYAMAESGLEDVLYRLKTSRQVSSSETLTLGTRETTTIITDISNDTKKVLSTADSLKRFRIVSATVTLGAGVSFNYGVQTGRGGIIMSNGSKIIGNVYANGDITGSGEITATAIAANTGALLADQINDIPSTPTDSLTFRNTSSSQDIAQSFQVSISSPINKVQFYIKKVGSPANASVRVVADNSGLPSTTNLLSSQGTISASSVTTSYGWLDVALPDNPTLYAGTTYWLVVDNSSNSDSNYYILGANDSGYSSGSVKIGVFGGSWNNPSPTTLDSYFKIYLGGLTATINGITVGLAGVGDAWAHTITGGSVAGTKYCQVGTGCNTSRPDPSPQNFPVSDANIEAWKVDAAAGGTIVGNYTPIDGSSLGPKVITGNLTISNGATMTLTGRVWVQGKVVLSNNSKIKLSAGYGTQDEVILVDGIIDINNNGIFENSGTTGSYIMAITTSNCPLDASCNGANAINLSNNAGAVVLNAQRGTIHINNNAELIEATAETLYLNNNAVITYQSGLANMNFSTGPSGSWSIQSWKETK